MELMTVGSISDMVEDCGTFDEDQVGCVAHAVLHGLAYLHSQKKLHRDIKAGNVLMDLSGAIKLGSLRVNVNTINAWRICLVCFNIVWFGLFFFAVFFCLKIDSSSPPPSCVVMLPNARFNI
jgi:hypothetical protein